MAISLPKVKLEGIKLPVLPKKRIRDKGGDISLPGLDVIVDAAGIVNGANDAARAVIEAANAEGRDPATGNQKRRLKPGGMADRAVRAGRRPPTRGYGTEGIFLQSFAPKKGRGKRSAQSTLRVSGFFESFLRRERARGVDYTPVDGKVEEAIDASLAELVKQIIQ